MNWIAEFCERICRRRRTTERRKIKGEAIVGRKNVADLDDFRTGCLDWIGEMFGRSVAIQLVSSGEMDRELGSGRLSKPGHIKNWSFSVKEASTADTKHEVEFEWDLNLGSPGAFTIKNMHHSEFFLKSFTVYLEGGETIHFDCYSWVSPHSRYQAERVFFCNKSYLPGNTPPALQKLRRRELLSLRGDGKGQRRKWERIYDYDVYNDLGDPDSGKNRERAVSEPGDPDGEKGCLDRPVLGGSKKHPYPRRCRTGRPPTKTDDTTESRVCVLSLDKVYVPRDERFGYLKWADFLAFGVKSLFQGLVPGLDSVLFKEFDSIEDVMNLYLKGLKVPDIKCLERLRQAIPCEFWKEVFGSDGARLLRFPLPQVVQNKPDAWKEDEEFAREMLAGVNPVVIQRFLTQEDFPPKSKLDPMQCGQQGSSITESHLTAYLDGLTVNEAIEQKRLFLLDHHDTLMPYVNRINSLKDSKIYATRTILFLKEDGTLKPVAIELSLPPPNKHHEDASEATRRVITPSQGVLWLLAKAYVSVNDSGHHQLISHWLMTHAITEPFVIATNRQLSMMHPVHKLLRPHFKDNLNINALARHILINAGGLLEKTVFPGKYAMEMSSSVYKDWRFDQQALPEDLLKRGMAEKTPDGAHIRLVIEDYPYAVDGLEIWRAIESWVKNYLDLYYVSDESVESDTEIQAWWSEIREKGHGDKKDEKWWYSMDTKYNLQRALTTIIWTASALHAAVNFGQYAYGGFMPNRPPLSRKLLPEEDSEEHKEMAKNPEKALLETVGKKWETVLGIALIEILSRHAVDEVYLGQRESGAWTDDARAVTLFENFRNELREIELRIADRNSQERLKNRRGIVNVEYTLLCPNAEGAVGSQSLVSRRGIPNSISI